MGFLLGYNLVRQEVSQAVVELGRISNEISFKYACQFIASLASHGAIFILVNYSRIILVNKQ
ncbi:mobile element protein [Vibrio ponticus]|nr:mobile element protein [Vibrio ponticus]